MQMISAMALQMDAQDKAAAAQAKEILMIKQQQVLESARVDELTDLTHQHDNEIDRIFNPNGHYYSVLGYARNKGMNLSSKDASIVGRKCSSYCKKMGISITKLNDSRYGQVGSYPEHVIALYL
jgi:hypothetical protein